MAQKNFRLGLALWLPLAVGLTVAAWAIPFHTFPSMCPFYNITGHPCPFCKASTAYVHVAHGRFGLAFASNPLGALFAVCAVASIPATAYLLAANKKRPAPGSFGRRAMRGIVKALPWLVGVNWIYMLVFR